MERVESERLLYNVLTLFLYFLSSANCACGNSLKYSNISISSCSISCNGNSSQKCGSSFAFSVYSTGEITFIKMLLKSTEFLIF
jgi:hypothetical protein